MAWRQKLANKKWKNYREQFFEEKNDTKQITCNLNPNFPTPISQLDPRKGLDLKSLRNGKAESGDGHYKENVDYQMSAIWRHKVTGQVSLADISIV